MDWFVPLQRETGALMGSGHRSWAGWLGALLAGSEDFFFLSRYKERARAPAHSGQDTYAWTGLPSGDPGAGRDPLQIRADRGLYESGSRPRSQLPSRSCLLAMAERSEACCFLLLLPFVLLLLLLHRATVRVAPPPERTVLAQVQKWCCAVGPWPRGQVGGTARTKIGR